MDKRESDYPYVIKDEVEEFSCPIMQMFIDYTAPQYSKGDIVKIKGKSQPFKVVDVTEDEDGTILYLVQQVLEYLVDSEQITNLIKVKK